MAFSLYRVSDGAGDSGLLCQFFSLEDDGETVVYHKSKTPQVGWAVRVGSMFARSFSNQDYWSTTPITEIIYEQIETDEDGEEMIEVKFKTKNSEYVWRSF